jgi:type IV secretory pathway VirB10-like protein
LALNYKSKNFKSKLDNLFDAEKELDVLFSDEPKKKKKEEEKKLTKQKAAKEKELAKQKAVKEKELAKQKAAKEKELAKQKAVKEKEDKEKELAKQKAAKEKAAKEKQLAKQKAVKEKEDKKLSLITAETDLKKAQSFLNNLQSFIKLYPDEFDIIKVSEFFILTRPILDGDLNFKSKKDLESFKEFVNTSNRFAKYYDEIRNNQKEKELNKINEAFLNLEKNIKIIKTFLVTDPNSVHMEKWLNSVKDAEIIINDPPSYNQLLITNNDLEKIIFNSNLK